MGDEAMARPASTTRRRDVKQAGFL
ncbi:hypothetical protein IL54_0679 [Sphingobium sp. ba1]|nr:hypothetical protein IL54_0679 [Sphingobium sp. ba1]